MNIKEDGNEGLVGRQYGVDNSISLPDSGELIEENNMTRRDFLGILGAVGLGALIPTSSGADEEGLNSKNTIRQLEEYNTIIKDLAAKVEQQIKEIKKSTTKKEENPVKIMTEEDTFIEEHWGKGVSAAIASMYVYFTKEAVPTII